MTNWKWTGACWWKVDFHTHTPASDCYGQRRAGLEERAPREWLLDFMRAEIDCVAVTDHNTGEWIDRLKEALNDLEHEGPDGYRALHLFPGVEISVQGGIHLLAIFSEEKCRSDIDTLLGRVIFSGTKGTSDAVTEKSFTEVVEAIAQAGGIAIPAHVDDENGLFRQQGTTLSLMLDHTDLFAMEVVNIHSDKPQLYRDKGLRWSEVLGSDSHHPSGQPGERYPGSHFTWVKMGEPCLEGLRLALLDGDLSVRRSDETTGDPNAHAAFVVESIKVTEARYMGRETPFIVQFNPWMNAVIGGRGTGKSTLVEFLRAALRRTGELPESLKPDLEKYASAYQSRNDMGLLTDRTVLSVHYRKDRTQYRIQWSRQGDVVPIEVMGLSGDWQMEEGDVAQRFPIRIYSQKQIFELAKRPQALLKIVDEAPVFEKQGEEEKRRHIEAQILSFRAKAREIETSCAKESELKGELEDIKRKLALFEQAGHASVLKEYQLRLRQQRLVESWEESFIASGSHIREVARDLVPDVLDAQELGSDDDATRALIGISVDVALQLKKVQNSLDSLAMDSDRIISKWQDELKQSPWQVASTEAVNAYEALRKQLAAKGVGDSSVYGALVQQRQSIEIRLSAFDSKRREAASMRRQAEEGLEQLSALRRELTSHRNRFLSNVLSGNPYVRIEVLPYGDEESVESDFRRLIQRESGGFEKDIEALLSELYSDPSDGTVVEDALKALKTKVRAIAEARESMADVRDQRFAAHLAKLPPEVLDRLDLWFPEDNLKVAYSPTADGSSFRSIEEGSPGQKTAALLAFLLSYGDEPIVLDQPEDDLDNHLIYDLIVGQLRVIKQRRQVIVVTHNANIVVNGDAELITSLAVRGGVTQRECSGSLQEKAVRDIICAVMEGGEKAFKQRYRRIALEGYHV